MSNPDHRLEVSVSCSDFAQLLKASRFGAKLGKQNIAQERVSLHFDGANLVVTAIGVSRPIPAAGVWEGQVTFALPVLGGLRKAPPTQNPLLVSYDNNKLKIGTTSIIAQWREQVTLE